MEFVTDTVSPEGEWKQQEADHYVGSGDEAGHRHGLAGRGMKTRPI
ncbi:hypothetical protein [Nocardia abscessus]